MKKPRKDFLVKINQHKENENESGEYIQLQMLAKIKRYRKFERSICHKAKVNQRSLNALMIWFRILEWYVWRLLIPYIVLFSVRLKLSTHQEYLNLQKSFRTKPGTHINKTETFRKAFKNISIIQ